MLASVPYSDRVTSSKSISPLMVPFRSSLMRLRCCSSTRVMLVGLGANGSRGCRARRWRCGSVAQVSELLCKDRSLPRKGGWLRGPVFAKGLLYALETFFAQALLTETLR